MFQIMVVDDDRNTRRLLQAVLEADGYKVLTAENGEDALALMDSEYVDLVVLDIMMPKMDGYEFTRTLRETNNNLPILMVSAKELPSDKKHGFLVGTDDYMTKPIDEEEMLWRIKALLRRAKIASERRIVVGDVVLDYDCLTVSRKGEVQELPQKEFLLLYKLLSYPGKIFTRIQLMDEIWGADSDTGWETVTVHVGRLRKRFQDWPEFTIESVRGLGYKAVKRYEQKAGKAPLVADAALFQRFFSHSAGGGSHYGGAVLPTDQAGGAGQSGYSQKLRLCHADRDAAHQRSGGQRGCHRRRENSAAPL